MPKKIEIFENTLLKLLVRRGSDVDRKRVTLSEGELGYTTDTKKLFIGDGQTSGGIPVAGTTFLGSVPEVTTFTSAALGDLAYDNDNNKLYYFKGGTPSNILDWGNVGGVYTAGDESISISNTNTIIVNKLSAGNFDLNALGNSLTIDSNNKLALDSNISISQVTLDPASEYLTIPNKVFVGETGFTLPSYAGGSNLFLTSRLDGTLEWGQVSESTIFVAGTSSQIPVGSIMPFISASNEPPGWLLCNGQSVPGAAYRELSAAIGTTYGGDSINFNVPNLLNKTIYGVGSSPATSTIYNIASGINSSLSATGAFYIIKAKPDTIVNSTITVNYPLSATLDGIPVTNTTIDALRGDLTIDLPPISASMIDVKTFIDLIYPVGSVYLSFVDLDPGVRFVGTTWELESEGRFLVGAGTNTVDGVTRTFLSGAPTGVDDFGRYTHTLTLNEIPAHSHTLQKNSGSDNPPGGGNVGVEMNDASTTTYNYSTSAVGGGQAHNNIPPYYGVYLYRRTA